MNLTEFAANRMRASQMLETFQEEQLDRLIRYQLNWAYYRNRMYDADVLAAAKGAGAKRANETLYRKIKSLFNVCSQVGNLDAATVLAPDVVVTSDNPRIEAAIVDVWKRSRLQSKLGLMILWGAVYGDVFLRVAGPPKEPIILLHDPTTMDYEVNPHNPDDITRAELSYLYDDAQKRRDYALMIYPDHYETYLDGAPWSFDGNPASYPHSLGVVPIVPLKLLDQGDQYGSSTYQDVLLHLDAVNEIASQMANIIRMNADPQMVAYNIKEGALTKGKETKGQTTVWYVQEQAGSGLSARLEMLEWSGNITSMTEFVDWCKASVEESLPEYHIKRVREQSAPSGYSVSLQLTEFQLKMGQMRRNAIEALRRANALALKQMGVITDLEDCPHDIQCGTILPKDRKQEQDLAAADKANGVIGRKEYLRRVGYDSDEIERVLTELDAEATQATAAEGYMPEVTVGEAEADA